MQFWNQLAPCVQQSKKSLNTAWAQLAVQSSHAHDKLSVLLLSGLPHAELHTETMFRDHIHYSFHQIITIARPTSDDFPDFNNIHVLFQHIRSQVNTTPCNWLAQVGESQVSLDCLNYRFTWTYTITDNYSTSSSSSYMHHLMQTLIPISSSSTSTTTLTSTTTGTTRLS